MCNYNNSFFSLIINYGFKRIFFHLLKKKKDLLLANTLFSRVQLMEWHWLWNYAPPDNGNTASDKFSPRVLNRVKICKAIRDKGEEYIFFFVP